MKRLTIQVRLAAWYFLSVAAIIALFAAGSWVTLQASMRHSIDSDLYYRMADIVPAIRSQALNSPDQISKAFSGTSDSSIAGAVVQITDNHSNILYQSDVLRSHHVSVMPPGPPDGSISISTFGRGGWPMRVASQRVVVESLDLSVHVVEPMRGMMNSSREYATGFSILVFFALLFTTTVGYWMSRRVLAPVEQIRKEADAIDPSDLTSRLQVPATEDELAKLAQTLNAMLARIEGGLRRVQQFTADASHELRAPLALIITAGEVSLRRERSREELAEALRKIVHEARHMSKLVEDLLVLARNDAKAHPTEMVPVDVAAILHELSLQLAPAAAAKGLSMTLNFPDTPDSSIPAKAIRVMGNDTSLRRLFLILIDNAIKYTEAGSVSLALSTNGKQIAVIVRDTGIGIEPSALPHVFDRFWRADKVRSRSEGGAGLGLALASEIVRKHGGTVTVESEPGKGSIFTVRLASSNI